MLDDAIFARGIHRLKDQQQGPAVLCVQLFLQFGSQKIKEYARGRGYIEIFERAGAESGVTVYKHPTNSDAFFGRLEDPGSASGVSA